MHDIFGKYYKILISDENIHQNYYRNDQNTDEETLLGFFCSFGVPMYFYNNILKNLECELYILQLISVKFIIALCRIQKMLPYIIKFHKNIIL